MLKSSPCLAQDGLCPPPIPSPSPLPVKPDASARPGRRTGQPTSLADSLLLLHPDAVLW